MGKNFVLTALEFKKIPTKLKIILKKTKRLNPEVRAGMIQAYIGVQIASDEINYRFDMLVSIIKARARVFCPVCQKKISRKTVLKRGLKKIKNCPCCKGQGSVTRIEIENFYNNQKN